MILLLRVPIALDARTRARTVHMLVSRWWRRWLSSPAHRHRSSGRSPLLVLRPTTIEPDASGDDDAFLQEAAFTRDGGDRPLWRDPEHVGMRVAAAAPLPTHQSTPLPFFRCIASGLLLLLLLVFGVWCCITASVVAFFFLARSLQLPAQYFHRPDCDVLEVYRPD